MGAQLGLPAALAARGLTVEVVPGWETRSAGSFNPKGAVCHWTAGPKGTLKRPSLAICTNGRADLPGPLCNVYLTRDGVAVVVAAGRANHAGAGSWGGATGNSSFFGTECEAAGPDDFTAAQRAAYPRVNAAFCDLGGFGADMVCGHSEYATPRGRKSDINGYTMTDMRADVASVLAGQTPTSPLQEDPLSALSDDAQRTMAAQVASAAKDAADARWYGAEIKAQTDRLLDEDRQTDLMEWGLFDPEQGLRVQVASLQGQLAGLTTAVQQLAAGGGGSLDMAAVIAAADRAASKAATEALGGLADAIRPRT